MIDDLRRKLWLNLKTWDGFLALGLGSGMAPKAPGTFGTLAAIPLALPLVYLPLAGQLIFLILAFLLGVLVCERVGSRLGVADHGAMVWDEFVGYWVVVLFLPMHWSWWLAAFVLFRLLDITKPWPIGPLEKVFPGGWGVMMDDLVAGLLTLLALWPLAYWLVP